MNDFQTLLFEKTGSVAWVTLNRPQVLNLYNLRMRDELWEVLSAIRDDREILVAVFCGAGDKAFCAGADLSEFLTASSPLAARKARWERDVWGLFLSIPQPLIAALQGYVLGSGLEIALCCDFRIAAESACFGLPEAGLGIIPAAGGTQTLSRIIGRARALELLFTNRWIDSEEAWNWGLVNRRVSDRELIPQSQALALQIAAAPPRAVQAAKRAVREGGNLPLAAGLNLERKLFLQIIQAEGGAKPPEERNLEDTP
jgi:enoyl-CoA hydratase/carnithine racemase